MADNLKLQQDINKLIAERNKMLEEGSALVQRQSQIYATLLEVMSGKKGAQAIEEMIQKLDAARESMTQMSEGAKDAANKTSAAFNVTGEDIDRLFDKTRTLSEHMHTKLPKAFVVVTAAVSGLQQGFRNIVAVGKGLLGVFESTVEGAFSLGKAILSIPFKIFDGLIEKAQAGGGANELMQAYEDVRKEFGSFKQDVAKNVIDTAKTMQGELAETGLSVFRVFGNMAERLKFVTETATKMGATFNVLGKEIAQNSEEIAAFQKGLGIAAEDMDGIGQRAIAMGTSVTEQLKDIANMSMQLGDAFDDLSSKQISRDVSKMIKDVKNFGSLSVKEMSEVSVYARKLGIEFTKLQGLIDKFDTFEGAAESAAKLSQAFGVNINAFEMMKKQSPAERMDELKKSFIAAGKSADNLSRQELKLIEDATGLDANTAKLALSSKNAGLSMDELKKKSDQASKKQLDQTQVMNKLADAIERMVMAGGPQGIKGFFDSFVKGIERGIGSSPEFIKLMFGIRRALMQVFQQGVDLGRFLVKLAGIKDIFEGISESFKPIPAFFQKLSDGIKQLVTGKLSLEAFVGNMQSAFKIFLDEKKGPFMKILQGFEKMMKMMSTVIGEGIKLIVKKLTVGLREATEFLKDPKKYLDKAVTGGKAGVNFVVEILKPIVEAVKDPKMWKDLWDAFKGFANEFWVQMKKVFFVIVDAIPTNFWLGVAGIFFGPALTRTFLGVGLNILGGVLKDTFMATVKLAPQLASAAASGSPGVLSSLLGPLFGNPYVAAAAVTAALAVVGVGMSIGVEKFKDDVVKKVGKGDKALLGSAAAGIIQTLSLGTISDDAAVAIGVNLANLAKKIEGSLDSIFGKAFADDLKEQFYTRMRLVIDLGDFVRSIFQGNAKGALKAVGSFAMDLLEMIVSSIKIAFVTIPLKISALVADLAGSVGELMGSMFSDGPGGNFLNNEFFQKIGGWIDRFGGYMVDGIVDFFSTISERIVPGLIKFAMGISAFFVKLPGALIGLLARGIESFLGSKNPFVVFLNDVKSTIYLIGDFINFSGKFLGEAVGRLWKYVKEKLSGKDTSITDVFLSLDFEKGFNAYRDSLKKATDEAVAAKKESLGEIAAVKPPAETNVGGFLSKASQALEGVTKLKASLAKVDEKELQQMQESFSRVVASFGDDKILSENVAKATKISEAFGALSSIAQSAASFKQNFDKTKDLGAQISELVSVVSLANTNLASIPSIDPKQIENVALARQGFAELMSIQDSAAGLAKIITTGGVDKSFRAIVDMVKKAQDLNDSITSMTSRPLEIKTKLQELATRLGLGSNQSYSIKNNGIEIKLDLHVTMDAGKVEEVIVRRQDSRIRKTFGETSVKDQTTLNRNLGTPF